MKNGDDTTLFVTGKDRKTNFVYETTRYSKRKKISPLKFVPL